MSRSPRGGGEGPHEEHLLPGGSARRQEAQWVRRREPAWLPVVLRAGRSKSRFS